jgi:Fur family ferric uptake transcriptional regulator
METPEERKFKEYLAGQALKFTTERRLILAQVFRMHGHFEVDDIDLGLRDFGERVSRASIYRTLPLLVDSGLLRDVPSPEKHSHYEHVFGHEHHDHILCTHCGRTIEFIDPDIEALQESICKRLGFFAVSHQLKITGLCEECRTDTGK